MFAVSGSFDAQFTDAVSTWGMESASVLLGPNPGGSFTQASFRQAYTTVPVVVALMLEKRDFAPHATRIRNVTTTGFQVMHAEPDNEDGTNSSRQSVYYVAMEAGRHELPDGTRIIQLVRRQVIAQHVATVIREP